MISQSQQSDFASSLYDGDLDNLSYLTLSIHPATLSTSQYTLETFDPNFLRPNIPLKVPSYLKRVGPDKRKTFVLYEKMSYND